MVMMIASPMKRGYEQTKNYLCNNGNLCVEWLCDSSVFAWYKHPSINPHYPA